MRIKNCLLPVASWLCLVLAEELEIQHKNYKLTRYVDHHTPTFWCLNLEGRFIITVDSPEDLDSHEIYDVLNYFIDRNSDRYYRGHTINQSKTICL